MMLPTLPRIKKKNGASKIEIGPRASVVPFYCQIRTYRIGNKSVQGPWYLFLSHADIESNQDRSKRGRGTFSCHIRTVGIIPGSRRK